MQVPLILCYNKQHIRQPDGVPALEAEGNRQLPGLLSHKEKKPMHVTLVHVWVKPESVDAFVEASRRNHAASVEEPGNRRFDILQDAADATKFVLYEAYVSAEDAAAHKQTAHYLEWRETVADMMARPRRGDAHNGLFPRD